MNTRRWIALLAALVMLFSLVPEALANPIGGRVLARYAYCNHNYEKIRETATCTSWGITVYRCSVCGDQYSERTPPLGHKWGKWEEVEPATCIQYGTRVRTCQRCGLKDWDRDYDSGLGDHDWGEWTLIKEPTFEEPGLEQRVCKIYAGHVEEREVPYTGSASLQLVISWAEDAGVGKRYLGAQVEIDCILCNEGNVTLYLPQGGDTYVYSVVPHGWETGLDGYSYARLEPGEEILYTYLSTVDEYEVEQGIAQGAVRRYAYTEMRIADENQAVSNWEQFNIPLSADALHLALAWAEGAGVGKRYEGAQVEIEYILTNMGADTLWVSHGDWAYFVDYVVPHDWETGPNGHTYARLEPGETLSFTYLHKVTAYDVGNEAIRGATNTDAYSFTPAGEMNEVFSNTAYTDIPLTAPVDENYLDVYLTYTVEHMPATPLQAGDEIWVLLTVHNDSDVEVFLEELVMDVPSANYQDDDASGWGAVRHSSVFAGETKSYPYFIVVSEQDVAEGQVVRAIANQFTPTAGEYSGHLMQTNFVAPAFGLEGAPTPANQDVEAMLTWAFVSGDKPIAVGSEIEIELTVWNLSDVDITLEDIGVAQLYAADRFDGWYAVKGSTIPAHDKLSYPFTIVATATDVDVFGIVERSMCNSFSYLDEETGEPAEGFTNEVTPSFNLDGFINAPALLLEASWAPDAGVGKRFEGAVVDICFTLTNTGDCKILYSPWEYAEFEYTATAGGAVIQDIGWGDSKVFSMAPGEKVEYIYHYPVSEAVAQAGVIQYNEMEVGYFLDPSFTWTDDSGNVHDWWDTVYSNTTHVEIPLTDAEAGASLFFEKVTWDVNAGEGKAYAGAIVPLYEQYTNTGSVPLYIGNYSSSVHDITVPGGWITSGDWAGFAKIEPGESFSYTYDYSVVLEDLQAGEIDFNEYDLALYEKENGGSDSVYSNSLPVLIPLSGGQDQGQEAPALAMIVQQLSPSGDEVDYPNDLNPQKILYDITLINTGNIAMDVNMVSFSWHVTDGSEWLYYYMIGDGSPLYPGESWNGVLPFEVFSKRVNTNKASEGYAGEIDVHIQSRGYYVNSDQVAATAMPPAEFTYKVKAPGPTGWIVPSDASLSVTKEVTSFSADVNGYQLGETISYQVTVTNDGMVPLTAIELHDELQKVDLGYSLLMMGLDLQPGESYSTTFEHRVTLDDVANGYVYNRAFAWWDDPTTNEELIRTYSNSVVVPVTSETGLMVKKTVLNLKPNGDPFYEGEQIEFQVEVHNNMPVHAYDVYVGDDLAWTMDKGAQIGFYEDLGPGEGDIITFKYTVNSYDALVVGAVTNEAVSLYYDEQDEEHFVFSNEVVVPCGPDDNPPWYPDIFGVISDVAVVKTETSQPGDGRAYYIEGETITYDITVTNTGEVPVEVIVYDSLKTEGYGEIGSESNLYPTDSRTYHYQHTVTAADVSNGKVVNYALAQWHPNTVWAETVTKSNEVWSLTSEDPNPIPPPFTPVEGESCVRTLVSLSAEVSYYDQLFCAEHAAVDAAAQAVLAVGAEDAWKQAQQIWRDALDAEYEELLEAVSPTARVSVLGDRMNFYLWLNSYERALEQLYPDAPDTVGEMIMNALMDRCADLCYELHTAPGERADSMVGVRETPSKSKDAPGIGRVIVSHADGEIVYAESLNDALALVQASVIDGIAGTAGNARALAFQRAQGLWQINLDASVNARYLRAGAAARQVIAMNRVFLDQMLAARTELLRTLYSDESVVAELLAKEYMHNAMYLYEK